MANRAGQQTQKQVKRRQKLEELFEEYTQPREQKMGGGYMRMADGGSVKPDFLDMDNDGNTSESMKSAAKQKRDKKMGGGEMLRMADGGYATDATMDATSNRATNGDVCRGGGAALRGTKFRGVF